MSHQNRLPGGSDGICLEEKEAGTNVRHTRPVSRVPWSNRRPCLTVSCGWASLAVPACVCSWEYRGRMNHPSCRVWFRYTLAAIPAVALVILFARNVVDVPLWDQWALPSMFAEADAGTLTAADLFRQANESRIPFPRLVMLQLGRVTGWNIAREAVVNVLLAFTIFVGMCVVTRRTVGAREPQLLLATVLSSLLIFSPIQFNNWLWSLQMIVFTPVACIILSLLVCCLRCGGLVKTGLCMMLAFISTFSFSSGVLCWVVVFPVLLLSGTRSWGDVFARWGVAGIWTLGFAASAALYFTGFHKPTHHPSIFVFLHYPANALKFYLSFFACHFRFTTTEEFSTAALFLGTAGVLAYGLACVVVMRRRREHELVVRCMPWLALGGYALLCGVAVTVGRLGMGLWMALRPRYSTTSLCLSVALIHLVAILCVDQNRAGPFRRGWRSLRWLVALSVVMFLILHSLVFSFGARRMHKFRLARLQGKSALAFINFFHGRAAEATLFPFLDVVESGANTLDRLGYLRPPLRKSAQLLDSSPRSLPVGSHGMLEHLSFGAGGGACTASGWAVLPGRGEPADAMVLAFENEACPPTAFAIAELRTARPDVARKMGARAYLDSGWRCSFGQESLPSGDFTITGWAFDALRGEAFRLTGSFRVSVPAPVPAG